MIKIILIILIIIVLYKIVAATSKIEKSTKNDKVNKYNKVKPEKFINITNPFDDSVTEAQMRNQDKFVYDIPNEKNRYWKKYPEYAKDNSKVCSAKKMLNNKNRLEGSINPVNMNKNNKINSDIELIKALRSTKNVNMENKKINKFFIQSQFNDAYRDILTAINVLCPDLKIIFNLQTLPVVTTIFEVSKKPPVIILRLINDFIIQLNNTIQKLPDSYDALNDYNNYLPMTAQLAKYGEDRGINKFYKDIGVDYNLYADTPKNAPVELIKIVGMRREYTEAETKYVVSIVVKKLLKTVNDQLQLTINFVKRNDPFLSENFFKNGSDDYKVNDTEKVAIEFIFIDGYFTNDFNEEYDCYAQEQNGAKKVQSNDGDDNYYDFNALGTNQMISDHEVITEFNKKMREHQLEMNTFSLNVPYPITKTK